MKEERIIIPEDVKICCDYFKNENQKEVGKSFEEKYHANPISFINILMNRKFKKYCLILRTFISLLFILFSKI